MDILERLQPMDFLFVIIWAGIVGWGLQTGVVRQLGMLVGVYGAALVGGTLYRQGGAALALIVGRDQQPQLEFFAYAAILIIIFGLIALFIWRAYPASRINRRFGTDNVLGAAVAATWGVLLLIALLTVMRFYAAVPWRGQETTQQSIVRQVQLSQMAPVLQVVASPLWQVMVPWFPGPVTGRI